MFPARRGDCLLISYGDPTTPRHILVDGGFKGTYTDIRTKLARLGQDGPLRLLVLSHVDLDHVRGLLAMLQDPERPINFDDVWFNGFDHLQDESIETFGAQHGELMTTLLVQNHMPWNRAFDGRSVEVGRPNIDLGDDATVTILSPDRTALEALVDRWVEECRKHGLIPGVDPVEPTPSGLEPMGTIDIEALAASPFAQDSSVTNRTTIAFLLEHSGSNLLLTGDAHPDQLVQSLKPLALLAGGRLKLDAMLVPHHGSRSNLSRSLLDIVDCKRFLFSTSGAVNQHPHDETVARIVKFSEGEPELVFNYRSRAERWEDEDLMTEFGYAVSKPTADLDGNIVVRL